MSKFITGGSPMTNSNAISNTTGLVLSLQNHTYVVSNLQTTDQKFHGASTVLRLAWGCFTPSSHPMFAQATKSMNNLNFLFKEPQIKALYIMHFAYYYYI